MLGNSIGGVSLDYIAQQTIETLVPALPTLKLFSTDFSDETPNGASAVTTRVVTQQTTGTDMKNGFAAAAQDSTITPIQIPLGAVKGHVVAFTDEEWSKSAVNLWDLFLKPGINAIAGGMIADAFATVISSNFSASKASTSPDGAAVLALKGTLDAAFVPANDRFILWDSVRQNSLLGDTSIHPAYAFGSADLVQKGIIPSLYGFSPVVQYVNVPSNSQNLVGIAGHKSAIALAARCPATPANYVGEISNVTDPDSGLTIQLRRWYSADIGKYFLAMVGIWGAAAANKTALVRITSTGSSSSSSN